MVIEKCAMMTLLRGQGAPMWVFDMKLHVVSGGDPYRACGGGARRPCGAGYQIRVRNGPVVQLLHVTSAVYHHYAACSSSP